MNNVSFGKNEKLQTRNRCGMIRSYRTARTVSGTLLTLLDMLLFVLDRALDLLARPAVRRAVRGVGAIACVGAFLCLIGAVESGALSLLAACPFVMILFALEMLCLRGN